MHEIIAADGKHYRLHPSKPHIVQVQDRTPPYHWRTWFVAEVCVGLDDSGITAADRATAMLARLSRHAGNASVHLEVASDLEE